MSDEQQFLITVDYGKYAYRYLFITSVIPYPEWPDDDKRWMIYDERDEVVKRFNDWRSEHIGGVDGKIIFVEPCDFVVADATKPKSTE